MANDRLEKQWREFCLACFTDISKQQYIDLRRTFYGGASAMYFVIMHMLDPGGEPTEEDLQKIRDLRDEIQAFNDEVKAGRA